MSDIIDPNEIASGDGAPVEAPELRPGEYHVYNELLSRNYLLYAVSVLTDRALPDIRDGLLPVHRRIMLAMNSMGLRSTGAYRKCAKVVGETMGNYHPHGDLAIYGALVRMAQTFSLRVPLIDPQGNFGTIDGDNAAASRYTECRLSPAAEQLLADLDPEILPNDFGRNYDGSLPEARVLPAAFPTLLVNGQMAIAVGMTCTMLPHNPAEILDLCMWRLEHTEATPEQVIKRVPGPDFPGGALVVQDEGLRESYLTGEGKVTAIGEAHIEPISGGREKIVITSLPYNVMKGSGKKDGGGFLQQIAKQWSDGKYPEMSDMNDFSTDQMRIEIELKRGSNSKAVLQRIYKHTSLRSTYGVRMNVLVGGQPRMVGFVDILDHFLAFRRDVLIKRAEKRIREIELRLHRLDAYLKALSAIDAVVETIKKSKDRQDAKPKLQKLLKIDEQQSQWIVEMALGSLTALDQFKLKEEAKELKTELAHLKKFIKTPAMVTEAMVEEFKGLKKLIGSPRQTRVVGDDAVGADADAVAEFSVPAEDCILLISRDGQAICGQGTLKRGASLQLRAGDKLVVVEEARTDQEWIVFSDKGNSFRLRLAEVRLEGKRHLGDALSKIIGIGEDEKVVGAFKLDPERPGSALFVYASGSVKRTAWSEFAKVRASGITAAKPAPYDEVIAVYDCPDGAEILMAGNHGKGIRFKSSELRLMGRSAAGVRGINLPRDAKLVGVCVITDPKQQLLLVTSTRFAKRIPLEEMPSQGRGGGGVSLVPKLQPKYGEPAFALLCGEKDELHIQAADGKLKIVPAKKVPKAGRAITPKPSDATEGAQAIFVRAES